MTLRSTLGLAAVAAWLFTACQQAPAPAAAADATAGGAEIVYIDTDSLFAKFEKAKDLQTELRAKATAADNDMRARGQRFQAEVQSYQQRGGSMTLDQRQATEARLSTQQQQLQAYQQQRAAELQEEQAKQQDSLRADVDAVLKELAATGKYRFVLAYSKQGGQVLYAPADRDVTAEVLEKLNAKYKAQKEKAGK